MIYNFFNRKNLKPLEQEYRKRGINKKSYSTIKSTDFANQEATPPLLDSQDSAIVLPSNEVFKSLPDKIQKNILNWSRDGYAIIPSFLSESEVNEINAEIERLDRNKEANWKYGNKIMFAIKQSTLLNGIANHPTLLKTLELLLGKKVFIFQSINFLKGSKQATHSDSIHMTTFPLGYLIAVWIALEDIEETSGPLHYYPTSHKLPYLMHDDYNHGGNALLLGKNTYAKYEEAIAEQLKEQPQLEKKSFLAKKGDILIWHANLLHGGNPILDDSKSRKSMVLHYYAEEVICYHEVTQRPAFTG